MKNRTPEFFARIGERGDDEGAGAEGSGGLRDVIKTGAGHDAIVIWAVGKMQTEGNVVESSPRFGGLSAVGMLRELMPSAGALLLLARRCRIQGRAYVVYFSSVVATRKMPPNR